MSKPIFTVFAFILILTQVFAARQKITIYEKPDLKGDSITLTKKYHNLPNWQRFFLEKAGGSYCVTGVWQFWDLPNFEYSSFSSFRTASRTQVCRNFNSSQLQRISWYRSGRFLGPEDFDTPAISLFKGNKKYDVGGQEYLLTGPAGNDLQFAPKLALSFGNSSWTLFTGKNFDGNSKCFTPKYTDSVILSLGISGSKVLNSSFIVQSVAKSCDKVQVANNINIFKNSLNLN